MVEAAEGRAFFENLLKIDGFCQFGIVACMNITRPASNTGLTFNQLFGRFDLKYATPVYDIVIRNAGREEPIMNAVRFSFMLDFILYNNI